MRGEITEREYRQNQAQAAYAHGEPSGSVNLGKAAPTETYGPTTDAWIPTQDACPVTGQQPGVISERLTLGNIDDFMKYQPWTRDLKGARRV